eukprot:6190081-Pleurochrysis_carterae.AAC.2
MTHAPAIQTCTMLHATNTRTNIHTVSPYPMSAAPSRAALRRGESNGDDEGAIGAAAQLCLRLNRRSMRTPLEGAQGRSNSVETTA